MKCSSFSRIRISILVIMIFFGSFSTITAAEKTEVHVTYAPISFVYDGKEYAPPEDQRAFIYKEKGRTYLPIRFVSYLLNKDIQWDGYTNTVTIHDPDRDASIFIDEYKLNSEVRNSNIQKVDRSKFNSKSITVKLKNITYLFDGELKQPPSDLPGMIHNGRLYVPMRFISESLGKDIDWDQETYTVSAKSEAYQAQLAAALNPETVPSVAVSKPTYEEIKAEADIKIESLQKRAYAYYLNLFFDYSSASSVEEQKAIKDKGTLKLAQFDSEFAGIIFTLRTKLIANEYSQDIADAYELKYEEEKAAARALTGF